VLRVEANDDGSYTAVIDYWPPAKVEQEPVAWMIEAESGKAIHHLTTSKIVADAIIECGRAKSVTPLYTAPPDAEALRADAAYWEEEARRYCGNADRWHARVTELERDAGRYRWLLSNAYVGIAPHPDPHEVWCLRLPNPKGCNNLDAAIDAAIAKEGGNG